MNSKMAGFSEPQQTQMINEYVKEFLKFNGYQSTLECLEAEERMGALNPNKNQKKKATGNPYAKVGEDMPRMYQLFENAGQINQREKRYAADLQRL